MAGEAARDPEFAAALDRLVLTPRREGLAQLLRRGIGLGDVDPDAAIDLVAELIPAFFMSRFLFRHVEITEADILAVVDDVAMPMLSRPMASRPGAGVRGSNASEPPAEQQLRYV